jgi:hypothetical protein
MRRDERWYDGWLQAWRRGGNDWLAYVRYSVGVGMMHLEWVGAERVQPA